MQEIIKLLIGTGALLLAYPLGVILNKLTKDEQKQGRPWFALLLGLGLISGTTGLIISKDWLMFFGFFVAIISSQSLTKRL